MMSQKVRVGRNLKLPVGGVAKPLHIQKLESALDTRPFITQVEKFLNSDGSDSDDDSDKSSAQIAAKGDKYFRGVRTSKKERQNERQRFYNLATVGKEREWMSKALISSDSEEEEVDTPGGKDMRIKQMLKERALHNRRVKDYYKDPGNSRYMYYGAGLLSTIDRYPERKVSRPGVPAPSTRGRRGRPSERGGSGMTRGTKPRRGRIPKDVNRTIPANVTIPAPETSDLVDGIIDWEEQLRGLKDENDDDELSIIDRPGSVRGRKKLSSLKSPEALTARRRRHWTNLVKKELGKVQRARTAAHREIMLQRKRIATLCSKHWRVIAMQSQKNMKETVWRCKRLSREMQAYWRRYDRAERETRRRMEKEAEEQRKMDVELMEAKRQRRKLNFLITQTELYAHFMQRKITEEGDSGADRILRQLDEDRDPRLAAIDNYDSEAMKAQAARNAREAFRVERARTQQFDAATGIDGMDGLHTNGDFEQPTIFQGTLKGYQLKGMNWLASLYDQGISGILADEMGLGKTVQCIAFLCHVAERLGVWGPFLVVSPASTLHNWQQEMERFVPDFKVVPYWGSPGERKILRQFWERKDLHTQQAAFHVVVTSYQIVVSDLKYLNRVSWQYMILDEAQAIKSSASMRWKLLLGFSCRNRLLLSGTPIQNSMAELWALLHFIMPTLFDSHEEFNEWFSKDIESHAENKSTIDEKHLSRLHMILKPFMLRRIKKDVENELSDKIEIMVHCPLTIRQKLLYIALKKKIKIEELLHYSVGAESGHNVDKNFTSNLLNLVMQFRKVCNHPELFERRDVRSPFAMVVDDYHIPKVVAEDGILIRALPSKRHLLYNKLSIIVPEYVHRNANRSDDSGKVKNLTPMLFGFTRFTDMSPTELSRIMLGGWLYAMQHIEKSREKYEKLRHRQVWWNVRTALHSPRSKVKGRARKYYDGVSYKDMLLVCPDGDILKRRKHDSIMWKELLFTDPVWVEGGPFFAHTELILHFMPESVEHRAMRMRNREEIREESQCLEVTDATEDVKLEAGSEDVTPVLSIDDLSQDDRPPVVYPCTPAAVPGFLYSTQPKVCAPTRELFAVSRSHAYHMIRHRHGECGAGAEMLTRLVAEARHPQGWASVQVPDKNQLVSDAGKLTVLDSLLKRLKERGHRVLIYSQMTKMIDLLEEYMWHRKHKYMRLDGSSKISARRDMVADFQARADIFVFLLSTRAGGLGINLTAADTVIFYDSDWNPTVDQQAMDRAHRLGQTKQVTVYRLICKGTIEERIMQRAREKSEIQRMVISGGNFKPDTLKPKEVVSLLLDDEEIEQKYRQKSEEKRRFEEMERKRKLGLVLAMQSSSSSSDSQSTQSASAPPSQPPSVPAPLSSASPPLSQEPSPDAPTPSPTSRSPSPSPPEPKRMRDSLSEPGSPLDVDDFDGELVVDASPRPASPISYSPPVRTASSWGIARSGRGSRRGRPRGSRHALGRRAEVKPADNAIALAAGAALLESDAPLEAPPEASFAGTSALTGEPRGRRGPGRPRLRGSAPRPPSSRRPRRPREPLLVPLAPPP